MTAFAETLLSFEEWEKKTQYNRTPWSRKWIRWINNIQKTYPQSQSETVAVDTGYHRNTHISWTTTPNAIYYVVTTPKDIFYIVVKKSQEYMHELQILKWLDKRTKHGRVIGYSKYFLEKFKGKEHWLDALLWQQGNLKELLEVIR